MSAGTAYWKKTRPGRTGKVSRYQLLSAQWALRGDAMIAVCQRVGHVYNQYFRPSSSFPRHVGAVAAVILRDPFSVGDSISGLP